jgi:TetR/AcrR family transcriptional repressor of mexJK operon
VGKPKEDALEQRLLTAAVEVFLKKGFAAASVDEIATRAKASKITFYNHFGNKEALFEAVVRRQNAALEEALCWTGPGDAPIDIFLKAVASRLFEALLKSDTVNLVRVLHAEADRFPQLMVVFNEAGPARAMQLLSMELEKQMAAGKLRQADPVLAAEHFLHLSLGELTRRILLGLRPPLSKTEVRRRIAAAIDVFLRAYAA